LVSSGFAPKAFDIPPFGEDGAWRPPLFFDGGALRPLHEQRRPGISAEDLGRFFSHQHARMSSSHLARKSLGAGYIAKLSQLWICCTLFLVERHKNYQNLSKGILRSLFLPPSRRARLSGLPRLRKRAHTFFSQQGQALSVKPAHSPSQSISSLSIPKSRLLMRRKQRLPQHGEKRAYSPPFSPFTPLGARASLNRQWRKSVLGLPPSIQMNWRSSFFLQS